VATKGRLSVTVKRTGASKATPPRRLRRPQALPSPVQKLDRVFTQRSCSRIVAQRWRPQQGERRPGHRCQPTITSLASQGFRPSNPTATGRRRKPAPPCSHRRSSQHTTSRCRSFIALSPSQLPDDASAGMHTAAANGVAAAHLMVASPRAAAGRRKLLPATGTERKTPPRRHTSHRGSNHTTEASFLPSG
jgi:hypothetical protein